MFSSDNSEKLVTNFINLSGNTDEKSKFFKTNFSINDKQNKFKNFLEAYLKKTKLFDTFFNETTESTDKPEPYDIEKLFAVGLYEYKYDGDYKTYGKTMTFTYKTAYVLNNNIKSVTELTQLNKNKYVHMTIPQEGNDIQILGNYYSDCILDSTPSGAAGGPLANSKKIRIRQDCPRIMYYEFRDYMIGTLYAMKNNKYPEPFPIKNPKTDADFEKNAVFCLPNLLLFGKGNLQLYRDTNQILTGLLDVTEETVLNLKTPFPNPEGKLPNILSNIYEQSYIYTYHANMGYLPDYYDFAKLTGGGPVKEFDYIYIISLTPDEKANIVNILVGLYKCLFAGGRIIINAEILTSTGLLDTTKSKITRNNELLEDTTLTNEGLKNKYPRIYKLDNYVILRSPGEKTYIPERKKDSNLRHGYKLNSTAEQSFKLKPVPTEVLPLNETHKGLQRKNKLKFTVLEPGAHKNTKLRFGNEVEEIKFANSNTDTEGISAEKKYNETYRRRMGTLKDPDEILTKTKEKKEEIYDKSIDNYKIVFNIVFNCKFMSPGFRMSSYSLNPTNIGYILSQLTGIKMPDSHDNKYYKTPSTAHARATLSICNIFKLSKDNSLDCDLQYIIKSFMNIDMITEKCKTLQQNTKPALDVGAIEEMKKLFDEKYNSKEAKDEIITNLFEELIGLDLLGDSQDTISANLTSIGGFSELSILFMSVLSIFINLKEYDIKKHIHELVYNEDAENPGFFVQYNKYLETRKKNIKDATDILVSQRKSAEGVYRIIKEELEKIFKLVRSNVLSIFVLLYYEIFTRHDNIDSLLLETEILSSIEKISQIMYIDFTETPSGVKDEKLSKLFESIMYIYIIQVYVNIKYKNSNLVNYDELSQNEQIVGLVKKIIECLGNKKNEHNTYDNIEPLLAHGSDDNVLLRNYNTYYNSSITIKNSCYDTLKSNHEQLGINLFLELVTHIYKDDYLKYLIGLIKNTSQIVFIE